MYDNLIVLPMMYHLFITHRLNFTFMIFLKRILRFGEVWNKPERLKLIPKINSTALLHTRYFPLYNCLLRVQQHLVLLDFTLSLFT